MTRHAHFTPSPPPWLAEVPRGSRPVGWAGLIARLRLNCPRPFDPLLVPVVEDPVHKRPPPPGWRFLDAAHPADPELEDDLSVASEHEVPNLTTLGAALAHPRHAPVVTEAITALVAKDPCKPGHRRLWFLTEWLLGTPLPGIPDLPAKGGVPVVDVLDPNRFLTALGTIHPRQLVHNNLLGVPAFCPYIRRSRRLEEMACKNFGSQAWFLLNRFTMDLTRRGNGGGARTESIFSTHGQYNLDALLTSLLEHHGHLDQLPLSEATLQFEILPVLMGVHPSKADPGYRTEQVYVSETIHTVDDTKDEIRFVTPRPADVASLMRGLFHTLQRMAEAREADPDGVDCVAVTAMLGFGLVFIHPFGDGNGRAHRFLMQQILRRLGYVPDMIFPVCNVMVRERGGYEECLQTFDRDVMQLISFTVSPDGLLVVHNATDHLYRYYDATPMVEYTYTCVQMCVERELPNLSRETQNVDNWSI